MATYIPKMEDNYINTYLLFLQESQPPQIAPTPRPSLHCLSLRKLKRNVKNK